MKNIFFISLTYMLGACSVKEASVPNNPLPSSDPEPFAIETFSRPQTFSDATWFLWKDHDDMKKVLQISAKTKFLKEKIVSLEHSKIEVETKKQNYMQEQMGLANYELLLEIESLIGQTKSQVEEFIKEKQDAESQTERDEELIEKLKQKIILGEKKITNLQEERKKLMDATLSDEDLNRIEQMQAQIIELKKAQGALKQEAEELFQRLTTLLEYHQEPLQLRLQLGEEEMEVTLIGFENQAGDLCSSTLDTIKNVKTDFKKGKLSFTVICKQRADLPENHLDIYKVELEQVSRQPLKLKGNMARCTDILPEQGECSGGLSIGEVSFAK